MITYMMGVSVFILTLFLLFPKEITCICSDFLSVDITDGEKVNSTIVKYGVTFKTEQYYTKNTTTYGCICDIKTCVRKCCGTNESFVEEDDYIDEDCIPSDVEPSYEFYDLGERVNNSHDIFFIKEKGCANSSLLQIVLDGIFYLQSNGSLYGMDMEFSEEQIWKMYNPEEYCVENVRKSNEGTNRIKAFICVPESVEEEETHFQKFGVIGE